MALGAGLVLALRLLLVLSGGNVIEIGHDLPAGMELAGQVVGLLDLYDLLLIVAGFLLNGSSVLIFAYSECDELLGDGTNFLSPLFSGDDLTVPQERGGQVAKHRVALVARLTQFTVWHISSS